ncbi:MAG: hypothetical protein ACRBBP_01130 [Bdellovibrionales bacterium]
MWKVLLVLLMTLMSLKGHSVQCRDMVSAYERLKIEAYAEKGSFEEFDYLETLMHSLYNSSVFKFRVEKFGYKGLEGLTLTPKEVLRIMVQFLNHRYTHVTQESLEAGRQAFERYESSGKELSSLETLAKALIMLHGNGKDIKGALNLLKGENSPQALWHKAEVHYKSGDFLEAKRLLREIESRGEESIQLMEALRAVEVGAQKSSIEDLVSETGFDHTQWGPY